MDYLVSAADRAAFKRCRRQWDFTATSRRRLRPRRAATLDLDRALTDALAVYYFPGMWDWDSAIVLPLVVRALDDSLARQREALGGHGTSFDDDADGGLREALERGRLVLERYFAWAPTVDRFSPLRVATDFDAIVPDPDDPDRGLVGPDGGAIRYTGRVDLLAMDEHDRYWIVRHRVTDSGLAPTEQLLLDEESVAACWAWARFYDGMEVAGTIYNEVTTAVSRADTRPSATRKPLADHPRGGIPQHEPSGGGRGVSSVRRTYVKGRASETAERMRQTQGDGFRRTVIRRDPAEVRAAGVRLAEEAIDMLAAGISTYPSPGPEHCSTCAFVAPCVAINEGRDVESMLADAYSQRPAVEIEIGRLGGSPYGVGRGWVPGPPRRQPVRATEG